MPYTLVAGPAQPVASLAEAKTHLRLTTSADDTYVQLLLDGAIAIIEQEIGSPLVQSQWKMTAPTPIGAVSGVPLAPAFVGGGPVPEPQVVRIERQKVVSVDTVRVRQSGAWVAWAASGWTSRQDRTSTMVRPVAGGSWPSIDVDEEAVEVTFTAGFGPPAAVPPPLKIAVLLAVGDLYTFAGADTSLRRTVVEGVGSDEWDTTGGLRDTLIATIGRLVAPYRRPGY